MNPRRWHELLFLTTALAVAVGLIFGIENMVDSHVEHGEPDVVIFRLEVAVLTLLLVSYGLDEVRHVYSWITKTTKPRKSAADSAHGFGFRQVLLLLTSLGGSLVIYAGCKYLISGP